MQLDEVLYEREPDAEAAVALLRLACVHLREKLEDVRLHLRRMPMPLSMTWTIASVCSMLARSSMRPPSGVYFAAFVEQVHEHLLEAVRRSAIHDDRYVEQVLREAVPRAASIRGRAVSTARVENVPQVDRASSSSWILPALMRVTSSRSSTSLPMKST